MFDIAFYEKEHTEIYDWYREKYAYWNSYLIPDGVIDAENYAGAIFANNKWWMVYFYEFIPPLMHRFGRHSHS